MTEKTLNPVEERLPRCQDPVCQQRLADLVTAFTVLYDIAARPPPAPWTREEIIAAAGQETMRLLRRHGQAIRRHREKADGLQKETT